MNTIDEAKAFLKANARGKGATCPCCNQYVKVYRRHITYAMSKSLIMMARATQSSHTGGRPSAFIHVGNLLTENKHLNSDWAKFEYWGLIEPMTGDRPDGSNRTGMWRLTDKGWAFVGNRLAIPAWVDVYNKRPLSFAPNEVTIKQTIGTAFDYDAMMTTTL